MTPGVFTDAVIGNVIVNEQDLVATSRMTELSLEIVAGAAILQNMDSRIVETGSGTSCMAAKVYTLRSSSLDKGSKTMTCDVTSTVKHGTDGMQLAKQALVNFENFKIEDIQCNNDVDFAQEFAYLSMKAKTSLEQKISRALVGLAATNADVPTLADLDLEIGTIDGNILQIPSNQFDASLLGNLKLQGRKTGMVNPIILNGDNFYVKSIINEFESNGCCSNDAILNSKKHFDIFWDVLNVDPVTEAKSTLIIDKNALLFWSSPVYDKSLTFESVMRKSAGPNSPNDTYKYVDVLPRLKYFANGKMNDIFVDVRAKRTCVSDALGVSRDAWVFEYAVYGDMRANMVNHLGKHGIYRLDRVTAMP